MYDFSQTPICGAYADPWVHRARPERRLLPPHLWSDPTGPAAQAQIVQMILDWGIVILDRVCHPDEAKGAVPRDVRIPEREVAISTAPRRFPAEPKQGLPVRTLPAIVPGVTTPHHWWVVDRVEPLQPGGKPSDILALYVLETCRWWDHTAAEQQLLRQAGITEAHPGYYYWLGRRDESASDFSGLVDVPILLSASTRPLNDHFRRSLHAAHLPHPHPIIIGARYEVTEPLWLDEEQPGPVRRGRVVDHYVDRHGSDSLVLDELGPDDTPTGQQFGVLMGDNNLRLLDPLPPAR
jgi:hypothetical protein